MSKFNSINLSIFLCSIGFFIRNAMGQQYPLEEALEGLSAEELKNIQVMEMVVYDEQHPEDYHQKIRQDMAEKGFVCLSRQDLISLTSELNDNFFSTIEQDCKTNKYISWMDWMRGKESAGAFLDLPMSVVKDTMNILLRGDEGMDMLPLISPDQKAFIYYRANASYSYAQVHLDSFQRYTDIEPVLNEKFTKIWMPLKTQTGSSTITTKQLLVAELGAWGKENNIREQLIAAEHAKSIQLILPAKKKYREHLGIKLTIVNDKLVVKTVTPRGVAEQAGVQTGMMLGVDELTQDYLMKELEPDCQIGDQREERVWSFSYTALEKVFRDSMGPETFKRGIRNKQVFLTPRDQDTVLFFRSDDVLHSAYKDLSSPEQKTSGSLEIGFRSKVITGFGWERYKSGSDKLSQWKDGTYLKLNRHIQYTDLKRKPKHFWPCFEGPTKFLAPSDDKKSVKKHSKTGRKKK